MKASIDEAHTRTRIAPVSGGSDSEEGRYLLQERLGLFMKVGFLISFTFLVVSLALGGGHPGHGTEHHLPHVGTLLVALSVWVACARARRSPRLLRAMDAGSIFLVCLGTAVNSLLLPREMLPFWRTELILQLSYWLISRAALVPSPPWRTLGISLACLALGPAFYYAAGPPVLGAGLFTTVGFALWLGGALAIATIVSWVVYGLRQQVREARRLGQYTLEEKLGEGGMGVVFRARHAMLRRPTAVKLLPPERAGSEAVARFEREVQLTAGLSHPNTVSIFDYGRTEDGVFYYAMEYLDGLDLERLVREDGAQPPARVAHVLAQVAAALGEAHAVGLIHRDIKPANVILCERGGVPDVAKVLDFGLVRDLQATDAGATNLELVKGTPLYMAPEALTAPETVDGRSDLYALGAVGYFLLTGVNVFEGRTLMEVCGHHLHTPPVPPSQRLGRPVPPKLEALLLQCLDKDPARRPPSARALRAALDACDDVGAWGEREARAWWAGRESRPGRRQSA